MPDDAINPASTNPTPGTITTEKLCALTGFTNEWLRQLAKRGYYSPPDRGVYNAGQTIQGLFRYFREQAEKSREDIEVARKKKLDNENNLLEKKIAEVDRNLVPLEMVERAWEFIVVELRQGIMGATIPEHEKRLILDSLQKIPTDDYFRKSDSANDGADASPVANAAAA